MTTAHEDLTAQFLRWELRGRGWTSFDEPVTLEPPYRDFEGHFIPRRNFSEVESEGRLGSLIGDCLWKLRKIFSPTAEEIPIPHDGENHDGIELWRRDSVVELQVALPKEGRNPPKRMESLILMASACEDPLAFEIIATAQEITVQLAASPGDAPLVKLQLASHFPEAAVTERNAVLADNWRNGGQTFEVAEFALAKEFMLPLAVPEFDFLTGLMAALSAATGHETVRYQVLFEPVRHAWGESALKAVSDNEGGSFFVNRPELLPGARVKTSRPLYAAAVRIGASAESRARAMSLLAPVASAIGVFGQRGGNVLIPLAHGSEERNVIEDDLLNRHSHRTGMLLNVEELASLAHFPDGTLDVPKLRRVTDRTRSVPPGMAKGSLFIGWNEHAGIRTPVSLTAEQRVRHMHLVGASGTGKSTLLFNLIQSDITSGQGLTVIDPHGDLIDRVLEIIPPSRADDVALIDPADEDFSVGFNVLSAESDMEKSLLASDLVSIFQRLSTSWGDQMGSVLNYAILAFLESSEDGTLADLQRFLIESDFRGRFLPTVKDEHVQYYWKKAFPQLGSGKSIGPLITRLGLFLSPKPLRHMVAQKENRLDFSRLMDSGKIVLARLPQGQLGKGNSFLLGSLLVAKLQQAAMGRQRIPEARRRLHTLYVDEFQNFCTPSMAEILSGTRKYRVALVLAHQSLDQIKRHEEVGGAVLANAGTRVVFRVGDSDARELERGFAHFSAKALQSLGTGEAVVRIERSDADFNIEIPFHASPGPAQALAAKRAATDASRRSYSRSRSEIEAEQTQSPQHEEREPPQQKKKRTPKPEKPAVSNNEESIPAAEESPPAPQIIEAVEAQGKEQEASRTAPSLPEGQNFSDYAPKAMRPAAESLGRGGALHQAAQMEIKKVAEALGFRAATECQVPGTIQAADLHLERDGTTIACEISVTNTLDAEIRNVGKHLRAGTPQVAVICLEQKKLAKLEAAIRNSLSAESAAKVLFFLKEDFIRHLQSLAVPESPKPRSSKADRRQKGWKVKTTTVEISEEETRQRENEIAATLAASLGKKRVRKKQK